jgi:ABC-type amino acid transport substrate-binding protein
MVGKRIAVQSGTTGAFYIEENGEGIEVVSFDEAAGPYLALDAGEVDGVMFDLVSQQDVANNDDTLAVVETFSTEEEYGLATKDAPNLLEAINASLAKFRGDGTYDDIYANWVPEA